MYFNTINFFIFLLVILLIFYIVPKKIRIVWLLIASYYFYYSMSIYYLLILLFISILTYFIGRVIYNCKKNNIRKKIVLSIGIITFSSILCCFKYSKIIIDFINRILVYITSTSLSVIVPVPVGLSFYIFSSISYIVDVYRDKDNYEDSFINLSLYLSYFPKLFEGPIERAKDFINKISNINVNSEKIFKSLLLIIWGLFLKSVMADRIAIFVNTVYEDVYSYSGIYLIVASLLYAIQIYCDFFGYTTIAIGISGLFGIDLIDNFSSPYFSRSIAEFWRRWHISLSLWLKDYIYIPLGGNRKGRIRKCINILVVFLISGIWHGSAITFVVWGLINGLYQVISILSSPLRDKMIDFMNISRESIVHRILCTLLTFILICISWIFFRSKSIVEALYVIKSCFTTKDILPLFDGQMLNCGLNNLDFILLTIGLIALIIADICKYKRIEIRKVISEKHWIFKCAIVILTVCMLLTFGKYGLELDKASYIYANF